MRSIATCIVLIGLALTPAAAADDACLKSVGAAHGANLFNTYTAIGAIADGYSSGMYTKSEVRDLMATQIGFAKTLRSGLDALASGNISDTDKNTILGFRDTYAVLENEARALLRFAETGKPEDLDAYNGHRKKAWTRIEKILGLDR